MDIWTAPPEFEVRTHGDALCRKAAGLQAGLRRPVMVPRGYALCAASTGHALGRRRGLPDVTALGEPPFRVGAGPGVRRTLVGLGHARRRRPASASRTSHPPPQACGAARAPVATPSEDRRPCECMRTSGSHDFRRERTARWVWLLRPGSDEPGARAVPCQIRFYPHRVRSRCAPTTPDGLSRGT